ncbi:MAG: dihydrolipoyl dehydrogenase [Geobacteraceae bacterium]
MADDSFDLIIIGAGPGGYTAAIRASQLGLKVALVEKRTSLGGVCLNEGCIPSKALLDSSELFAQARDGFVRHGIVVKGLELDLAQMMARKEEIVGKLADGIAYLIKKNRIQRFQGSGKLAGARRDGLQVVAVTSAESPAIPRLINGKRVLLATGSRPVELPQLPYDGKQVVSSREALSFTTIPDHLLIIGAGYIGLELGSLWNRLGSEVTVVEALPSFLPHTDGQVAETLLRSLTRQGIRFLFDAKIASLEPLHEKLKVRIEVSGASEEVACDRILVSIGRVPETSGLGLAEAGVRLDEKGRITVDKDYQTSSAGIFAIGDLVSGPLLAHKAMEEGTVCVERMAGQASLVEYDFIPSVTYTTPEVASVGKTEEQLRESSTPYVSGRVPFSANGRARCMDDAEGFVKVLTHQDTGRVLGIHIVGPHASELISEAVTVITYGGSAEDIALTFHAHPTLSEALKEAALDSQNRAIHA